MNVRVRRGLLSAVYRAPAMAALLLWAATVLAADLRPLKETAKISDVFPPASKVRVLNVWAMWCVPCVAEMPDLRAIDDAFGKELAIVGVSLDDMLPDAKSAATAKFLDKQGIAFPNAYSTGNADADVYCTTSSYRFSRPYARPLMRRRPGTMKGLRWTR